MEPNPNLMAFMSRLLPPVTGAISLLIPGRDSRIAWRNAKNNAEIIQLVAHVNSVLPPRGSVVPLKELVDRCYALGPFPALWAVEGLGHYYADTFLENNQVPRSLLSDGQASAVPSKSMTMLHAGIGMAFAKRTLQHVKPDSPASEIRKAVQDFVNLCRSNSRQGYAGAAIESLGLASRFLHGPKMVRRVDEQLSEIAPDLLGYLWHGVGRAVYFSPPNFIPGWNTPWRAVEMCHTESSHELGRHNMIAGFSWAVTLVNMRYPVIMETVLKYHGRAFAQNDAFANGVMSSIIMRYDITPEDPYIVPFYQYRPANAALLALWESQVKEPCETALKNLYPILKQQDCLEEVFRYQNLAQSVDKSKSEHRHQSLL